jgi:energy-coupling factor transport system ATP-binding protein
VAAEEFLSYLDRERRRSGTTVLLAEQRLDRGLQLADRVVVLVSGRVVFDGTPGEFLNDGWGSADEVPTPTLAEVFRGHGTVPIGPREAGIMLTDLLSRGALEMRRRQGGSRGDVIIRCDDVHFSYQPGKEVLRGADLEIRSGEVLVLVGPNGSGKTTLARHLNGLLRPAAGRVLIAGDDTSKMPVSRLSGQVALLTQNPGDYLFERTVDRELRLTASYRGLDPEEAADQIERLNERLGLFPFRERFSWDLSAGQRQRVALGALMVGAPRVMVLDEPTRGMDTSHKASLARMLRELAAEGKAIVVITHDQEFGARVADRYAVLEDGRITFSGWPWEVFSERPEYAPILWRATEGMDLSPEARPLTPDHLLIAGEGHGGGGAW